VSFGPHLFKFHSRVFSSHSAIHIIYISLLFSPFPPFFCPDTQRQSIRQGGTVFRAINRRSIDSPAGSCFQMSSVLRVGIYRVGRGSRVSLIPVGVSATPGHICMSNYFTTFLVIVTSHNCRELYRSSITYSVQIYAVHLRFFFIPDGTMAVR
jgi:hypothetical protein